MTIEEVPGTNLRYHLISFDEHGNERIDDPHAPNGRLSEVTVDKLKNEAITDVFFISHGWKGDVPAAKRQYNEWIRAMAQCEVDRKKVREVRSGFSALIVGLHWPSLPWGEEDQNDGAISFGGPNNTSIEALVEDAADKIANTSRARLALETIFAAAMEDIEPAHLPPKVVNAYQILVEEAGLGALGPAGAPGDDADEFNAERAYQDARAEEAFSFGGSAVGGLLSPLRQLSFWKMKKRARTFGETGAATLLRHLQQATLSQRNVCFHLMGHSFGCIAISAMIAGRRGGGSLPKPADSVYLVQGAMSLWSFCSDIPVVHGRAGYFHDVTQLNKVSGPILTTQSEYDTAVGKLYPLAAGVASQVDMAPGDLPKYGAIGTFGVRGPGVVIDDLEMGPVSQAYDFSAGQIYNLESSHYISEGSGFSGAHNDIAKPEVAHAFWQAVIANAASTTDQF